ncbi:hypothetical protein HAX54_016562 [Datura stramonium]|uniref:Uncharacterized protein n=1 Tax=Datura stramonium TaxID=4076 RepID=A0ABS8UJR2_DATST|nr:hypothetical protein [Datura stramonium]
MHEAFSLRVVLVEVKEQGLLKSIADLAKTPISKMKEGEDEVAGGEEENCEVPRPSAPWTNLFLGNRKAENATKNKTVVPQKVPEPIAAEKDKQIEKEITSPLDLRNFSILTKTLVRNNFEVLTSGGHEQDTNKPPDKVGEAHSAG